METKESKNRKATFLFKTEKSVLEAIKYLAEKDNRSTNNYIETIMRKLVKMDLPISNNIPNKETINTFKESKIELKSYKNTLDLINDL
jgi:hypothetical protein